MSGLTYRDAGVDIQAGDRLVDRIKPLAARTKTPESMGSLGGFAALCGLPEGMKKPILVSGTDGVGTKLKVAFEADRHHTVGIDLVAMCANDVVTVGARPLFFLDYFATAALNVDQATSVISGIAEGCEQAGCALLGGETAELPGMYSPGEYDLAGFVVGVVEQDSILTGELVQPGDAVIGVSSDGLHSNGFSLARAALLERGKLKLDSHVAELGEDLVEALLRPTRIYCRSALAAAATGAVRALCHVTGGGLPGNLPRVLPGTMAAAVDESRWPCPPIFELVQRHGQVSPEEMRKAFNMGVGLVAVAEADRADEVVQAFAEAGEQAQVIGRIEAAGAGPRVTYA